MKLALVKDSLNTSKFDILNDNAFYHFFHLPSQNHKFFEASIAFMTTLQVEGWRYTES